MAEKAFVKVYQNFEGLDYLTNSLSGGLSIARELTNYQFSEGQSIKGRKGMQVFGQYGITGGFHTFSYYDNTTGEVVEELLAINDNVWRLKRGTLVITGGTNLNHTVRVDSGTSKYRFVINNGATPYTLSGNPYFVLGTGLESEDINTSTPKLITMEDLRAAIDANASLACALPTGIKFARVNGDQVVTTTIEVDAGHNYVAGDIAVFYNNPSGSFPRGLTYRRVEAVLAAPVRLQFDSTLGSVSVWDNQVIGPMATPAASLYVADSYTSTNSSISLNFYYFDYVLSTFHHFGAASSPSTVYYFGPLANYVNYGGSPSVYIDPLSQAKPIARASFLNINNACLIGTQQSPDGDSFAATPFHGNVIKYDGVRAYRAGLPKLKSVTPAITGGGVLTGTYYYRARLVYVDAKGNRTEGMFTDSDPIVLTADTCGLTFSHHLLSDISTTKFATVNGIQAGVNNILVNAGHTLDLNDYVTLFDRATGATIVRKVSALPDPTHVTISGAVVSVNNADVLFKTENIGFQDAGCAKDGATQNVVNTISILNSVTAPNRLGVGDIIYFLNRDSGRYETRTLTAVSLTSITWSGGTAGVNANDLISANLRIEIYRTKAGGRFFYFLEEIPAYVFSLTGTSYSDNKADTALGVTFIDVPIGKEPNPPPKASILAQHQGAVVYTGIRGNPNQFGWSDLTGGPEAVPLASNYSEVPTSVLGAITACGSDSEDKLALFKANAYYSVEGTLDDGNFITRAVSENDFGISAHASLAKVKSVLVGIGPLGPIAVSGGQLLLTQESLSVLGARIAPRIASNFLLVPEFAVGFNDSSNREYVFYMPGKAIYGGDGVLVNYPHFSAAYSYESKPVWFDRSWANTGIEPNMGFTVFNGTKFYASNVVGNTTASREPGHFFREINNLLVDSLQAYADNHLAITNTWTTDFETLGEPSIDKAWAKVKVWALPSTYEREAQDFSYSLLLQSYRNFSMSVADSSETRTYALTESTPGYFERIYTLMPNRARGMAFKLTANTIFQCPFVSGIEVLVPVSYAKEDFVPV